MLRFFPLNLGGTPEVGYTVDLWLNSSTLARQILTNQTVFSAGYRTKIVAGFYLLRPKNFFITFLYFVKTLQHINNKYNNGCQIYSAPVSLVFRIDCNLVEICKKETFYILFQVLGKLKKQQF